MVSFNTFKPVLRTNNVIPKKLSYPTPEEIEKLRIWEETHRLRIVPTETPRKQEIPVPVLFPDMIKSPPVRPKRKIDLPM